MTHQVHQVLPVVPQGRVRVWMASGPRQTPRPPSELGGGFKAGGGAFGVKAPVRTLQAFYKGIYWYAASLDIYEQNHYNPVGNDEPRNF